MSEEKAVVTVKSPARDRQIRKGKGFSFNEIKEAGKTVALLKEVGIFIDYFRRSSYKENVDQLKKIKAPAKKDKRKPFVRKEKKIKPKPKKVYEPDTVVKTTTKKAEPKKATAKKEPAKKATAKKKLTKEKAEPVAAKKADAKAESGIIELTQLSGLGPASAKKFIELGVGNVQELCKEKAEELVMLIKGCSEEKIKNWIDEGKKLLKK